MKLIPIVGILVIATACSSHIEEKIKDKSRNEPPVQYEVVPVEDRIDNTDEPELEKKPVQSPEWTYEIVPISEGNWGYQLFQNGKMIINQTTIPSVQGNNGFATAEKAERTAEYILKKLENGIFPPTVEQKELEELDVLRD